MKLLIRRSFCQRDCYKGHVNFKGELSSAPVRTGDEPQDSGFDIERHDRSRERHRPTRTDSSSWTSPPRFIRQLIPNSERSFMAAFLP